MKGQEHKSRRSAVKAGLTGIVAAVIGFVPIYYMVYVILKNHWPIAEPDRYYEVLCSGLGTLSGAISACCCACRALPARSLAVARMRASPSSRAVK